VTLNDVAREAGVSQATASRAINGSTHGVRPELRERVLAAALRLNYTPNAAAQAMVRGRTTTLGLIVHDIADPYFSSIAAGVAQAAGMAGLQVMLASTEHDPAREVGIVELLKRQRARAIVVAGGRLDDRAGTADLRRALALYRQTGGRVAGIGQPVLGVDTVVVDNAGGAAELARELHRLGYRSFAMLGGPERHLTAWERREAFLGALADLGVDVPDERVIPGGFDHEGGARSLRRLLATGIRPEVVFAVNDVMALGALGAARELGVRVPDDIALAGFDDIPTLRDVTPGLTTVCVPLVDLGVRATELALSSTATGVRLVDVPVEVVVRESTPGR